MNSKLAMRLSAVALAVIDLVFPSFVSAHDESGVNSALEQTILVIMLIVLLVAFLFGVYFAISSFTKKTGQSSSKLSLILVEVIVLLPFFIIFLALAYDLMHAFDLAYAIYQNPVFFIIFTIVSSVILAFLEKTISQLFLGIKKTFRLFLSLNLGMIIVGFFLLLLFGGFFQ